jgi:Protein of unknown function (DUF2541)
MKLRTTFTVLLLSLGLSAAVSPLYAASAQLLGSTRLTKLENDRDVLRFSTCRGGIRALQIAVRGGNAELERVRVHYRNGGHEDLELRQRIAKGGQSRWIDLNGGDRCIEAIAVIGDTENSRKQANIKIFGR